MKRIISFIILLTIVMSSILPVFAEVELVEESKMELTIQEAIDTAMENNYEILAFDRQLLIAERYLKSAIRQSEVVKIETASDAQFLENGKTLLLYPAQRQRELDDLINDAEDLKQNLQIDITSTYMELKHSVSDLEVLEKGLETLKSEFVSKQREFELGLVTSNLIADLENAINQAELNIKKAKWENQLAHMELAKLIGVDLNTQFLLTDTQDYSADLSIYDIDALAASATEFGNGVLTAAKDIEMKELEKEVVRLYTRYKKPEGTEDFDESIADLMKDLDDARLTEEIKIRSDYTSIINADLDVQINTMKLELVERELNVANIKYSLGMFIKLDVVKVEDSHQEALNNLESSKLTLFTLVENFDYYISGFTVEEVVE